MLLIFILSTIFILGLLISFILVPKMYALERFGISFLLGMGIITFVMFCYSTLGVKITRESTIISIFIALLIALVLIKLLKRKINIDVLSIIKRCKKLSKFEKVLTLLIGGLFVGSLIESTYFPVYICDALAIYDFRGKVIADLGFYTQIARNYYWFDGVPLFTSMSHAISYLFGSRNSQFIYSLIYCSFVLSFYGTLRIFTSKKTSLLTTLLLSTIPTIYNHSTFAYTNMPYAVFISLSSIYLYIWITKKKEIGYLILSAILMGLSTWTRSTEPFWVINILLLVLLCFYKFKRFILPAILFIVIVYSFREPWNMVNNYLSVKEGDFQKEAQITQELSSYGLAITKIQIDFNRIKEIIIYIYKNIIRSWYPLLFLFGYSMILNTKSIFHKKSSVFLLLIFLYFSLLLFGTYFFSFGASSWRAIPDSARRMAMFFMPLMVYYIGLTFDSESINKTKGENI